MKYYIKTMNTETKKSMIMPTPTFTSKRKAEEWAKAFDESMNGLSRTEVIKH